MLPQVREPVLLVLDDDARLSAAALAQLVDELGVAGVDLVTALPCYRDDAAHGARLMAQFVNNNAVLTYLGLLPWLPPLSINGMCYALRSERLRDLGGFSPLLRMLADDLALARALRRQGRACSSPPRPWKCRPMSRRCSATASRCTAGCCLRCCCCAMNRRACAC